MPVTQTFNVRLRGAANGPVLLFAHGFGCDQNMWRLVTPAFEETHRIVLFDYVGHGRSDLSAYDPKRYSSLDGYAQDILDICAELGLSRVNLVGHSVSSMIGVLAAIREPSRFKSLVLVSPSPSYLEDGDYHGGFKREDILGLLDTLDANYLGWASTMAPVIMGTPDRPELVSELENAFCRTDPEIAKQFARVTFLSDLRDMLPRVPVPTLTVQVTRDALAPVSVGEYIHAHTPGNVLELVDTDGHCPHLSAPGPTVAAMRRFFAR